MIVGAGFGGLSCALALRRARASVTLIDRHNYHLFQPLLYQVATAALSPGDIATPIRSLFRESFNTKVLLNCVTGVDTARGRVFMGQRELAYDYLVLATGAAHSYFGKDQWQQHAPGLKRIEDATAIRRRLLMAFEQAETTEDVQIRRALLTFLIVGGGPTGVELAGAIAELARHGMEKDFRQFDPASARVILVQSASRLLPSFAPKLAAISQRCLERLGVEVLIGHRVEHIDADGVSVGGQRIAARTVFWAAARQGIAGGRLDWRQRRQCRPRQRAPRLERSGSAECVCYRRYGAMLSLEGSACARVGARRPAGRRVRGAIDCRASDRSAQAACVYVSSPWQSRNHWAAGGGGGFWFS